MLRTMQKHFAAVGENTPLWFYATRRGDDELHLVGAWPTQFDAWVFATMAQPDLEPQSIYNAWHAAAYDVTPRQAQEWSEDPGVIGVKRFSVRAWRRADATFRWRNLSYDETLAFVTGYLRDHGRGIADEVSRGKYRR